MKIFHDFIRNIDNVQPSMRINIEIKKTKTY